MGKGEAVLRGANEPRAFVARGTRVGGADIELIVEAEDREGRGIGRRSRGARGEVERRDAVADPHRALHMRSKDAPAALQPFDVAVAGPGQHHAATSAERLVGKECVSTLSSRVRANHKKKKN